MAWNLRETLREGDLKLRQLNGPLTVLRTFVSENFPVASGAQQLHRQFMLRRLHLENEAQKYNWLSLIQSPNFEVRNLPVASGHR